MKESTFLLLNKLTNNEIDYMIYLILGYDEKTINNKKHIKVLDNIKHKLGR